jgi:hypothetical protein
MYIATKRGTRAIKTSGESEYPGILVVNSIEERTINDQLLRLLDFNPLYIYKV